jgi:LysM repeat protein
MSGVPGQTYVTVAGDTLMAIAERFNISVVTLRVVNRLGFAANVAPGTSLFIPEGATPYDQFPNAAELQQLRARSEGAEFAGNVVVVQPQETVDGIGARLNKDHYCILAANNITNPRLVIPGTALVIPAECGPYTGFDVVGG